MFSLHSLPIWIERSGVAVVLTKTSIRACARALLRTMILIPLSSSFLCCSILWFDLWPSHLALPVLTTPWSSSCETISVCAWAHLCSCCILKKLCALQIKLKRSVNTFVYRPKNLLCGLFSCFHLIYWPVCPGFQSARWNLLHSFPLRFLAPSAEDQRNCIHVDSLI